MIIRCPACQARYRIDETKANKSVARIKCPKCAHAFEVAVAGAAEQNSPAPAAPSIVVVDDARFFREVLADILAALECPLHLAASGEEGLALVRQIRPALVILDLKLPGMGGLELIQALRSDQQMKGLKILAMSSVFRQDNEVHKILLAGADDFLNKSFKPEHLLSRIESLLAS